MLVLVLKHKNISGLLLVLMLDQFIKCLCLRLSIFRCACPIPDGHYYNPLHILTAVKEEKKAQNLLLFYTDYYLEVSELIKSPLHIVL